MSQRRRAPIAVAGLLAMAAIGGLVVWSHGIAPSDESPAPGGVSVDAGPLSRGGPTGREGSAVTDGGVASAGPDGPADVERLRGELAAARELLSTRQRMVDRGAALREALEQNAARREVREQLTERRAAAVRRRDEALDRVRELEAALGEHDEDAGAAIR